MRFRLATVALAGMMAGALLAGAPRTLKVLVLYDMEGVSEATSLQHTNFDTPEYRQARVSLTALF